MLFIGKILDTLQKKTVIFNYENEVIKYQLNINLMWVTTEIISITL